MATPEERIARLEEKQNSQDEHCRTISNGIHESLGTANKKLDRIEKALKGGDGNPGLCVRMDRLERGRKAWLAIAVPTAIAIISVCLRAIIWGF